jgi:hypothetical protein
MQLFVSSVGDPTSPWNPKTDVFDRRTRITDFTGAVSENSGFDKKIPFDLE